VALPSGVELPTLSLTYRVLGPPQTGDACRVSVSTGLDEVSRSLFLGEETWAHGWLGLTNLAEQTASVEVGTHFES